MNIKSLLIGSALATAGVTGAQAADAIVVPEPEPMEYVRVCDVYGAGFFYIPGTETCLKIGGYVRYQIDFAENDDGFRKFARGTLTVDARSETEYGTLGAFIEARGNYDSGGDLETDGVDGWTQAKDDSEVYNNGNFDLYQAYMSLGGLFIGKKVTLWDASLSGEFDYGGWDDSTHTIGYTFDAANGVYVAIALEEYDYNYDYTPNVVGKVGIAQGWGDIQLLAAYDATYEEWAAKIRAEFGLTDRVGLELLGTYASGESWYSTGYEWSAGAYLKFAATDKLSIGFGGQYFADSHGTFVNAAGDLEPQSADGGADDWALGAVIDYALVENFNTKIAINYVDGDTNDALEAAGEDVGNWEGFIRFERNF